MACPFTSSTQLVWLITGTSSGFGHELVLSALSRGDKVIATARACSMSQLDDLKAKGAEALELDVTAPIETLKSVAAKAVGIYSKVDVVVNNAGCISVSSIEENTPEETFHQFNTNLFGAVNVTRAFLPYMRERTSGTVVFIGSLASWVPCPSVGVYAATKHAVRSISSTLHVEVAPFGLRSVCIEPGYFQTSLLAEAKLKPLISCIDEYKSILQTNEGALKVVDEKRPGDLKKAVEVMVDLVRGEGTAKGKAFPRELVLGGDCYDAVKDELQKSLRDMDEWKEVICSTDFLL